MDDGAVLIDAVAALDALRLGSGDRGRSPTLAGHGGRFNTFSSSLSSSLQVIPLFHPLISHTSWAGGALQNVLVLPLLIHPLITTGHSLSFHPEWPWEPEHWTGYQGAPVIEGFIDGQNCYGRKQPYRCVKVHWFDTFHPLPYPPLIITGLSQSSHPQP